MYWIALHCISVLLECYVSDNVVKQQLEYKVDLGQIQAIHWFADLCINKVESIVVTGLL